MKKRWLPCYLLMLCCSLVLLEETVKADETQTKTVTVEEADFSIEIPENCYVLTQTIEEENPYIAKVGANKEQVEEYFVKAGIVLDAMEENDTYEIVVTVNQNQDVNYIYNMKSITDDMIKEFADTIAQSYQAYGYQITTQSTYENENQKYVKLSFSQTTEDSHISCVQYDTIKGNKVYNITLRYYGETIPAGLEQDFTKIVDSIVFLSEKEMISFTNRESGVSFALKDGWESINSSGEKTYVKAQFMHTNGLGESIQFLCMDLWGNMDTLHQIINTREQIDIQHVLTTAEKRTYQSYLEGFFADYDKTKQVKYNGIWYVTSDELLPIQEKNINGNYLQKTVATIKNGILYVFQYGYYEGNNLHEADFEQVMENIVYTNPELLSNDQAEYQQIATLGYGIIAVVVLCIAILVFVAYLYFSGSEQRKNDIN